MKELICDLFIYIYLNSSNSKILEIVHDEVRLAYHPVRRERKEVIVRDVAVRLLARLALLRPVVAVAALQVVNSKSLPEVHLRESGHIRMNFCSSISYLVH